MERARLLTLYLKDGSMSPARRKVIANLVRAQEAIVKGRRRLLVKRLH
jgi:hypothetical protein